MGVKFSNNGHSTLAASVASSDTSITVASGHGARFPSLGAGDYFYATLIDASNNLEIVKCTARSSDVLTVTRAQEGTTARAYAIGDRIELRITAAGLVESSGVEAGTAQLFVQTAAPTGWTKSTSHNNKALRIVSGTASSGGSVDFTTAFASQSVSGTVGGTTLSTSQIPSHNHGITVKTGIDDNNFSFNGGVSSDAGGSYSGSFSTASTGGGGSHDHSFSGTAINLAVSYVDVIIATKD